MRGRIVRNYIIIMAVFTIATLGLLLASQRPAGTQPRINTYYPLPEQTANPQQTAKGSYLQPVRAWAGER
jgi:hypothetical protein